MDGVETFLEEGVVGPGFQTVFHKTLKSQKAHVWFLKVWPAAHVVHTRKPLHSVDEKGLTLSCDSPATEYVWVHQAIYSQQRLFPL